MRAKKETKEVTIKLNYFKSKVDKENGIYYGGVSEPKFLDDFIFNVEDDYDFNIETEEFEKNGKYSIEILGTKRALKELGKFLINMATYSTSDDDYHEHIDDLKDNSGQPCVNLTFRRI